MELPHCEVPSFARRCAFVYPMGFRAYLKSVHTANHKLKPLHAS
jgi:hypothetical protein